MQSAQSLLLEYMELVSRGDYEKVAASAADPRLDAEVIESLVADYGGTIIVPNELPMERIHIYEKRDRNDSWVVECELSTTEEDPCDLTLSMEMNQFIHGYSARILNIHVL